MSLIRNGGFERGNTDFWSVETDGTLEISDTDQKYGGFCGKYIAGATANEYIINNDYIEVNPFDLLGLFLWIKSNTARSIYPCMYTYDADYSFIGVVKGMYRNMTGAYLNINTQIPIPEGVAYVRVGFQVQTAADEVFYFDGYSANILKADRILSGGALLADLAGVTTSGNTQGDRKDLQMYNTFEGEIMCNYASGGDTTLDVRVYEVNLASIAQLVGTFTQITTTTEENITLTHCTGRQLYIEYDISGTSPYFEFKVYVAGKR